MSTFVDIVDTVVNSTFWTAPLIPILTTIAFGSVGFFAGRHYKNKDAEAAETRASNRAERQRHIDLLEQYAITARSAFDNMIVFQEAYLDALQEAQHSQGDNKSAVEFHEKRTEEYISRASGDISNLKSSLRSVIVKTPEMKELAEAIMGEIDEEFKLSFEPGYYQTSTKTRDKVVAPFETALIAYKGVTPAK